MATSSRKTEAHQAVEYLDWDPLLGGLVTQERLLTTKLQFDSHVVDIRQVLGIENGSSNDEESHESTVY